MLQHKGTQPLHTQRLNLRRLTERDAETMFQNWLSDDEVTKYMRFQTHRELSETRAVLEKWLAKYDQPDFYHWGIENTQTGELMGTLHASVQSEEDEIVELGYCIGRDFWNKGYMTEACTAAIRYLIFEVGANRVEACHSVNNPASGRVMEKAGMRLEGTIRQGYRCRLGFQDTCLYGILREDFKKTQG